MSATRFSATLALALLAAPRPATAIEVLAGALKSINERGEIAVGYRSASVPFSFVQGKREDGSDRPIGYAIDLCGEVVDEIARAVGRGDLKVRYVPVTPETRIEAVASGKIDLECGTTTANADRRRSVAFSPIIYISATKLLVRKGSPVLSYRDLEARKLVLIAGTTNEGAVRGLLAKLKLQPEILTAKDNGEGFAMVKDGRADAFATDDVVLYGMLANDGAEGANYSVLADKLSFEPFGLMYRKDDAQLASTVTAAFTRLAESRELRWIYERWFLKRLPNGERLNIPLSTDLRNSFQLLGLEE